MTHVRTDGPVRTGNVTHRRRWTTPTFRLRRVAVTTGHGVAERLGPGPVCGRLQASRSAHRAARGPCAGPLSPDPSARPPPHPLPTRSPLAAGQAFRCAASGGAPFGCARESVYAQVGVSPHELSGLAKKSGSAEEGARARALDDSLDQTELRSAGPPSPPSRLAPPPRAKQRCIPRRRLWRRLEKRSIETC